MQITGMPATCAARIPFSESSKITASSLLKGVFPRAFKKISGLGFEFFTWSPPIICLKNQEGKKKIFYKN